MTTSDDFYGDGSEDNTPECSYCGQRQGKLIVSISDHNGPTHWHHEWCQWLQSDAKAGPPPPKPTWDEAMDVAECDHSNFAGNNRAMECVDCGYQWSPELEEKQKQTQGWLEQMYTDYPGRLTDPEALATGLTLERWSV